MAAAKSTRPTSGRSRALSRRKPALPDLDAMQGIAWFNSLTPTKRRYWLNVASSAVPADAWAVYKRDRRP